MLAEQYGIPVLQPAKLDEPSAKSIRSAGPFDVFLVASYGKIIPAPVLGIPERGSLNIHPSLLPKYRGPSPIQSQILAGEENPGVTLMLMDEQVDHGPIAASKHGIFEPNSHAASERPYTDLEMTLAKAGTKLFADSLGPYLAGTLIPVPQDHGAATFTRKIAKADGELDLAGDPRTNYRKFLAYSEWPRTYFFVSHHERNIRVIVTEAAFEDGQFVIKRVLPEGKKEMLYEDFVRGLR
jgi:methionyl-tRNA formyltransferase